MDQKRRHSISIIVDIEDPSRISILSDLGGSSRYHESEIAFLKSIIDILEKDSEKQKKIRF